MEKLCHHFWRREVIHCVWKSCAIISGGGKLYIVCGRAVPSFLAEGSNTIIVCVVCKNCAIISGGERQREGGGEEGVREGGRR